MRLIFNDTRLFYIIILRSIDEGIKTLTKKQLILSLFPICLHVYRPDRWVAHVPVLLPGLYKIMYVALTDMKTTGDVKADAQKTGKRIQRGENRWKVRKAKIRVK